MIKEAIGIGVLLVALPQPYLACTACSLPLHMHETLAQKVRSPASPSRDLWLFGWPQARDARRLPAMKLNAPRGR